MKIPRIFGHIPGIEPGQLFASRAELKAAGLHRHLMAGISGADASGADAIVISGGYEDDSDRGDEIIYTGHGGNSLDTKQQIADQQLHRGNLALARSCLEGLPVRVIRGHKGDPEYSPPFGYRYDGLYYVNSFWQTLGKSGFMVWRFHLTRRLDSALRSMREEPDAYDAAPRSDATIQRIVRNSDMVQQVKTLHDYHCQVCGIRLETLAGPYAEGAHIRPLGHPHDGPDTIDNILCLCPNCHVRFDYGAIVLADNFAIVETATHTPLSRLRTHRDHRIDLDHVRHHRDRFVRPGPARDE